MSKGNSGAKSSGEVWSEIDSGLASHVGKRVFYQDSSLGKCLAFITVPNNGNRDNAGRLVDKLIVFSSGGSTFAVEAPQDSGRSAGTWDVAQEGDK